MHCILLLQSKHAQKRDKQTQNTRRNYTTVGRIHAKNTSNLYFTTVLTVDTLVPCFRLLLAISPPLTNISREQQGLHKINDGVMRRYYCYCLPCEVTGESSSWRTPTLSRAQTVTGTLQKPPPPHADAMRTTLLITLDSTISIWWTSTTADDDIRHAGALPASE